MNYILSFVVAFGVAAIAGLILIPLLRRLKAGQMIREDGPTWHMSKQGTPSMGGLMFILAMGVALVAAGWESMKQGQYNHIAVFLFALVFGVIGFIDDFQKLRHKANEGLTAPQKFVLQLAAAVVFLISYGLYGEVMRENAWLSRTVEVREGQSVVDTGMYGIVRHPMYAVTVPLFLSVPLILGSLWGLLVFCVYPALLVLRIRKEEELLEQELEGYAAYREKVRYRMIPYIW